MDFGSHFTYAHDAQEHISFPLGGLGAGCLGLSGRGRLVDWEIFNRPNKGSTHGFSHFLLRAEKDGEIVDSRILNGPIDRNRSGDMTGERFSSFGFGVKREYLAGLPHFRECVFRGFYPAAEIDFIDLDFPGFVTMRALSPFVPGDTRTTALPVAMFEISVRNTTEEALDFTLFGTLASDPNCPQQARVVSRDGAGKTLFFDPNPEAQSDDMAHGALALSMLDGDVSHQHYWYRGHWFDALQKYWNAVTTPGALPDRQYDGALVAGKGGSVNDRDHGTLASRMRVDPGETRKFRLAINWRYPNFERYWDSNIRTAPNKGSVPDRWTLQHSVWWPTIDAAVDQTVSDWSPMWQQTRKFAEVLRQTDLPDPVLDAISSTISTLKSPTVTLFKDSVFYGFEGSHMQEGCCEGSCTHVWNYQQALPFLFPDLAQSLVATDFEFLQDPDTGGLAFRTPLPLGAVRNLDRAAVDGHYGTVLRVLREAKVTGDDNWLRDNWQQVKAAIGFAWHPDNNDKWDPEKTGIITGRQHHTLDMELFGPNSWLTSYYLAALKAGVEMAQMVGDTEAAQDFAAIFDRGKAWADSNLFNGRYYGQKLDLNDKALLLQYTDTNHPIMADNDADHTAADGAAPVRAVTADAIYWNEEAGEIKYQIGEGMVIDQVTGCWLGALCGVSEVFDPRQVSASLNATFAESFRADLRQTANPCRVYAVDGEGGTLICSWPEGTHRPDIPLPYSQETQGGYEYAFGGALLMAGELRKGVQVFEAIRGRYRGWNRNPWNEVECGSNYARAMASYAALPLMSGFDYDLGKGRMGFAPKVDCCGRFQSFWALGGAWGQVRVEEGMLRLSVFGGGLRLRELTFDGNADQATLCVNAAAIAVTSRTADALRFDDVQLRTGDELVVSDLGPRKDATIAIDTLSATPGDCGC